MIAYYEFFNYLTSDDIKEKQISEIKKDAIKLMIEDMDISELENIFDIKILDEKAYLEYARLSNSPEEKERYLKLSKEIKNDTEIHLKINRYK